MKSKIQYRFGVFLLTMVLFLSMVPTSIGSADDGDLDPFSPILHWNTFLGSASDDYAYAVTTDRQGYLYVAGVSNATWGNPKRLYKAGLDAFVAKLDRKGKLIWNTFLGGAGEDTVTAIAIDSHQNVYIVGHSDSNWGSPRRLYTGGTDAYVAKLTRSGFLAWNTYLGAAATYEDATSIVIDSSNYIYVTGEGHGNWAGIDAPLNPYSAGVDTYVAKIFPYGGDIRWYTFMGGAGSDKSTSIKLDPERNVYISGNSDASWGTPLNPYGGGSDGFVAMLNRNGTFGWSTFVGSAGDDFCNSLSLDSDLNLYVVGQSNATWGTPLSTYKGGKDAFVARMLSKTGEMVWNTFLGSATGDDGATGVVISADYIAWVVGYSTKTWGAPINPHAGGTDIMSAKVNIFGELVVNSFNGSAGNETAYGIIKDLKGFYLVGAGNATWDIPRRAYTGGYDAIAEKLAP